MTYQSNINALKANIGLRDKEFSRNTKDKINNINAKEKESIKNIQGLSKLLVGDSPTSSFRAGFENRGNQGQGAIPWAYGGRVRGKKEEAEEALKEDNKRKVEAAAVLQKSLEGLKAQDTEYYKIKRDMLLNGAYYEDADRFTKLSPHAQSFYAQAKLGLYNEKVEPLLTHWLAKNEDQLNVGGIPFTPKDTFGKDSDPLIFKEHAINTGLEEIRRQNGIDGFSEEIQLLAATTGVDGAEQKAKRNLMSKFRKQNAIETSNRRLQELLLEIELDPEGMDFNRALLIASTLVNAEGEIYDNAGALDALFNQLKSMGVDGSLTDTLLAKIKATPNPIDGTLWGVSHKRRFDKLEADIEYEKNQILGKQLLADDNDKKTFEKQFTDYYENWKKENPGERIDSRFIQAWYIKGRNLGLFQTMPAYMSNILTLQSSDDKQNIDRLRQLYDRQGFITRSDLWGTSPAVWRWAEQGDNNDGKGILVLSEESGKAFGTQYLAESGEGSVPWVIEQLVDNAMGNLKGEQPVKYTRGVTNAKNMFLNSYNNYVTNESYSPEQAKNQALKDIKEALEPQGLLRRESILFAESKPPDDAYREKRNNSVEFIQKGLVKHGTSEFLQTSAGKLEGTDKELKQALEYLEGKALMPKLYQDIADQFQGISADKLLRWQLIAHGVKTPEEVRVKEPTQNATIALDIPEFNELNILLGFKPTTCSTQQAACLANYQKNQLLINQPVEKTISSEGGLIDSESGHIAVPSGEENQAQKEASELEKSIDQKANDTTDLEFLQGDALKVKDDGQDIDQNILDTYFGGGVTYATGGDSNALARLKYLYATRLLGNNTPREGDNPEIADRIWKGVAQQVNDVLQNNREPGSVESLNPLTGDYATDMKLPWVQKKIESGEWKIVPMLDGKEVDPDKVITEEDLKGQYNIYPTGGFQGYAPSALSPKKPPKYGYRIIFPENTDNDILSQYTVPGSPYLNADLQGYSGQLIAMNLGTNPTVPLTLEAAKTDLDKWNYIVNLAEKSGAKFPELIAAQFMLESARGTKVTGTNNYFGLKTIDSDTDSTVLPTQEWEGGKFVTIQAPFKNFESPEAAVEYLAKLWYHDFGEYNGINNAATIEEAAKMLVQEGYATDPAYAKKLLQLIKEFQKLRQRKTITV
tara:strand:+ start:5830 stop:9282 length:3453 start_codon:yes stop_codon:yes gene_type:complete